jgi:hypothetical protein
MKKWEGAKKSPFASIHRNDITRFITLSFFSLFPFSHFPFLTHGTSLDSTAAVPKIPK